MIWITIVGIIAAIITTIAFLPQAIKTIKTKQTKALSLGMLSVQATGNFMWLLYGFLVYDIPIIFANIITGSLVIVILFYKIKYK